jgi:aminoglycoside 6'-N-acetyltransferase
VAPAYVIRSAGQADLPLLAEWRSRPHVRRWWGDPADEPETEMLADPRIGAWIVELAAKPFAFIQDYRVDDWPPHHFDYLPPGSRGMDVYIGEADMLGLGHGSRLVRQHADRLFALGAPAVGIDPHPDNAAARRAFEKAGFTVAGGPLQTRWSLAILMDRRA